MGISPILKAKYQTYWEAEAYDLAEAIARGMRIHHPHLTEGWLMGAECLNKLKGRRKPLNFCWRTKKALENRRTYFFAIGRYSALANDLGKARISSDGQSNWTGNTGLSFSRTPRLMRCGIVFETIVKFPFVFFCIDAPSNY